MMMLMMTSLCLCNAGIIRSSSATPIVLLRGVCLLFARQACPIIIENHHHQSPIIQAQPIIVANHYHHHQSSSHRSLYHIIIDASSQCSLITLSITNHHPNVLLLRGLSSFGFPFNPAQDNDGHWSILVFAVFIEISTVIARLRTRSHLHRGE